MKKEIEYISHDYDTVLQVTSLKDKVNQLIDVINELQSRLEEMEREDGTMPKM